jgi:hypothetical protein
MSHTFYRGDLRGLVVVEVTDADQLDGLLPHPFVELVLEHPLAEVQTHEDGSDAFHAHSSM